MDLLGQGMEASKRQAHQLETTEQGTCRDMERKQQSNRDSLPGDGDLPAHEKEATDDMSHFLGTIEGGTCQDMERK